MTVRCLLDRALANEEWHTLFPCSYTEYLGLVASDHRPMVAYLDDKVHRRKGQFRFDKRWVGQEGLLESITMGWSDDRIRSEDDIVAKISNCRHEIAKWRKNNPPYGKEKISDLQKALRFKQIMLGHRRILWRSPGSYKKLIRMKKIIGTRKVGICGILRGI